MVIHSDLSNQLHFFWSDVYPEIMHVIRDLLPVLGGKCNKEILVAVSPLLSWVELDMRVSICNLLVALAETDHSVAVVVIFALFLDFLLYYF